MAVKTKSPSSGKDKVRRIKYALRRTKLKVKRWRRYQDEIAAQKRSGPAERWNTSGLESHIKYLEKLAC